MQQTKQFKLRTTFWFQVIVEYVPKGVENIPLYDLESVLQAEIPSNEYRCCSPKSIS